MQIKHISFFILVFFFTISTVFASEAIQPNGEQINTAVTAALKSQIPVSWVGNLMGGRLIRLGDLQVVRIGIYNKESKYWPMKIRCIGLAAPNDMFNKDKRIKFDKVGDFLLFRDDYGDWKANMRGSIFQ
jgi:hypothetical protein